MPRVLLTPLVRYSIVGLSAFAVGSAVYKLWIKDYLEARAKKVQAEPKISQNLAPTYPRVQFNVNGVDTISASLTSPQELQSKFNTIKNLKNIDAKFTKDCEDLANEQSGLIEAQKNAGKRAHWHYRNLGLLIGEGVGVTIVILELLAKEKSPKGLVLALKLGFLGTCIDFIRSGMSKLDKPLQSAADKKTAILNTRKNKPVSDLLDEYSTKYKDYTSKLSDAYRLFELRVNSKDRQASGNTTFTENEVNLLSKQLDSLQTCLDSRAKYYSKIQTEEVGK